MATCIIRPPVITPEMTQMEKQYSNLLKELEYRISMKSDHEIRQEDDVLKQNLAKSGEEDVDTRITQTALEFEDACKDELANFKLESKLTG